MDAGTYTSCGEEVPLGVECALPRWAGNPLQDGAEIFPSSVERDRGAGSEIANNDPGASA